MLYLLTGAAGSGKTAIGQELAGHGYDMVDADDAFCYYGNPVSGFDVSFPRRSTKAWLIETDWPVVDSAEEIIARLAS